MKIKTVCYDFETLANLFTGCFLDYETKKKKSFVLYDDINQFWELYKFLRRLKKHEYYLVGFNNIGFDAQIVEHILYIGNNKQDYNEWTIEELVDSIYKKAQEIINTPDEDKFKILIPEWKFSLAQIDVFKQKHYDRPQKSCSLKWLQFTMRRKHIKEMPIEHWQHIEKNQIDSILIYNWEDVEATAEFFDKIMFETDLRLTLSEKFELRLLNASEPKIARDVFGKFLSEQMGITYSELKQLRTFRNKIPIKNIIFPYVKFENPIFNELLNELRSTVLTTEEKFEKIINVYNLQATFALGGLHSNNSPRIVSEDDDWIIITSDVSSMYPNLAIENNVIPAHLGDTFIKVYKSLYEERKKYDKKDPINYVYKIILNSAYGLSSEKNSYLYDVQYTRSICINGELSLLMLCENVKKHIPEAEFIMLNTDGIEVRIPKSKYNDYFKACKEWEDITKLILEHGQYKKMVIADCNNYIAIDNKDNVKKKGKFETNYDFHKNPSFTIIPMALEQYFVYGQDYVKYIMKHDNIFDFCGAVKKKSNFELNLYHLNNKQLYLTDKETIEKASKKGWRQYEGNSWIHEDWIKERKPYDKMAISFEDLKKMFSTETSVISKEKQQKVCRFFVANSGGLLKKDFNDGRQTSIIADKYIQPLDTIENESAIVYDINRNWYISEVRKIIFDLTKHELQTKLF